MFFKAMVVAIFVAASAEPAAYKFNVDAPAGVAVTVKIDGKEVKPGKVYETAPFAGEKEVSYEVTWTDPEEGKVKASGVFTVKAGYVTELTFRVPRHYIGRRPPAD